VSKVFEPSVSQPTSPNSLSQKPRSGPSSTTSRLMVVWLVLAVSRVVGAQSDPCQGNPLCIVNNPCDLDPSSCSSWPGGLTNPPGMSLPGGGGPGSGGSYATPRPSTGVDPGTLATPGPRTPPPVLRTYDPAAVSSTLQNNLGQQSKGLSFSLMSSQLNSQGNTLPMSTPGGNLTVGQGSAQPEPTVANLSNTEPVGGSGEFFFSDIDLSFPGYGIDFTFRRLYRSGASTKSPLGPGWSHSYRQFIVQGSGAADSPACPPSQHPDMFHVDDTSSRRRLVYQPSQSTPSSLVFQDPQDQAVTLVGTGTKWTLHRAGDPLSYQFDGPGQLRSIGDRLGHQISVEWQGDHVSRVVDTTGRSIYFVVGGTPSVLQCLSLIKDDCTKPLVRFDYNQTPGTFAYLSRVIDAEGRVYRKYRYWNQGASAAEVKALVDMPTMQSALVEPTCRQFCGKKADDCRNLDRCEALAQAAQNAMCPGPPWGCDWFHWGGDCLSNQRSCLSSWPMQRIRDQFPDCQQKCFDQCRAQLSPPNHATWFGRPAELIGNMTEVSDGVNNIIVRNTYGEDPSKVDFDRVISHQQNLPGQLVAVVGPTPKRPARPRRPRPDAYEPAASTQTFAYHDLVAERATGLTSPEVTSLANWKPITLCPCVVPLGGPKNAHCTVRDPVLGPLIVQNARYAVVVRDLGGVTRTQYFDPFWRLLRSVNVTTAEQEDYNYANGRLVAERNTVGQRVCREYDGSLLTRVTTLAAPGRPGDATPHLVTFDYNANSELITALEHPEGVNPRGTHLLRDDLGRIVAVGTLVDSTHTDWSCAEYSDELRLKAPTASPTPLSSNTPTRPRASTPQSSPSTTTATQTQPARSAPGNTPQAPIAAPQRDAPRGSPSQRPAPSGDARLPSSPVPVLVLDGDPRFPFTKSGCYFNVNRSIAANKNWRAVQPSKLTSVSGMVTQQTQIGVGGAGYTTVDATGPDPIFSYAKFDDFGRPVESGQQDAQGRAIQGSRQITTYDNVGLTKSITIDDVDGTLHATTIGYDAARYVTTTTDERAIVTVQHDAFGQVLQLKQEARTQSPDAKTQVTCMQYDALGRLVRRLRPEGELEQRTYDPSGRLQQIMNGWPGAQPERWAMGCTANVVPNAIEELAAYSYDRGGMPAGQTQHGIATRVVVDGFGRAIDQIRPIRAGTLGTPTGKGKTAEMATHIVRGYDALDRVTWLAVYDVAPADYNRPTSPTPGLVSFTAFDYDAVGRPTKQLRWVFPGPPNVNAVTTYAYDDTQSRFTVTDEEGVIATVVRDGLGRTKQSIVAMGRPEQETTTRSYSNGGSVVTSTETAPTASGTLTTTSTYSPRGELLTVADSSGTLLSQTFHNGVVTDRQVRGRGSFRLSYDAFWRLQQTQNEDLTTTVGYDRDNRTTSLRIDTADYSNTYDPFDRVVLRNSPTGLASMFYPKGQAGVGKVTDPSRITHEYQYDLAGRPISITNTDGNKPPIVQTLAYNAFDQLLTATRTVAGAIVPNQWTYDSLGRALSESSSAGRLDFTYKALDRTTTIAAAGESTVLRRQLDGLRRPTLLTVDNAPFAMLHRKNGAIDRIKLGNDVEQTRSYDNRALPSELAIGLANGQAPLLRLSQNYDSSDIPKQRKLQIGQSSPRYDLFESDKRGRVAAEILDSVSPTWDPSAERRYILDPQSNWLERRGKNAVKATINAASQLMALGPLTFTYDPAGNVATAPKRKLTWTALGELESVTEGTTVTKYTYDALSRPVTVEAPAHKLNESILWSRGQRAALIDSDGLRAVVSADASTTLGDSRAKSHRRTYLHPGFDGSTLAASGSNPALETYRYSAYGEETIRDENGASKLGSAFDTRFRFQGQYQDPATSYYALGARHYAPGIGRFLSADPIGPVGGINPYVYVGGLPLTLTDPSGLSAAHTRNDAMQRLSQARQQAVEGTPIQENYYTPPGWVIQHRQNLIGVALDPNRGAGTRILYGVSSLIGFFPDMIARGSHAMLNISYSGDQIGQYIAQGSLSTNFYQKVDSYSAATANFANGFNGAASVIVPFSSFKPGLTTPTLESVTPTNEVGAGGNWATIGETPGGAVGQTTSMSCGAACGEMLSGVPQSELIELAGAPTSVEQLSQALGPNWRGGLLETATIDDMLALNRPFAAEFRDGGRIGHLVVVNGRQGGNVVIFDPWGGGTTYQMAMPEFQRVWSGRVVFNTK